MTSPRALLAVFAIAAAACSGPAPDETSSGADCGSKMWPRVIIGVTGGAENRVAVQARLADGTILDGIPHGCPALPEAICSYSFFTAPRDKEFVLLVRSDDGNAELRIALGPFTYEARNITYIVITLSPGGPPQIGDPRLIHPC